MYIDAVKLVIGCGSVSCIATALCWVFLVVSQCHPSQASVQQICMIGAIATVLLSSVSAIAYGLLLFKATGDVRRYVCNWRHSVMAGKMAAPPALVEPLCRELFKRGTELAATSSDMTLLFSDCPDSIFLVSSVFNVQEMNPAAEKITRRDAPDFIGAPFCDLFRSADKELITVQMKELQGKNSSTALSCQFASRSGRDVPVSLTITWYGRGYIVIARDLTVFSAEEQLRRKLGKAIRNNFANCLGELRELTEAFCRYYHGELPLQKKLQHIGGRVDFLENMLLELEDSTGAGVRERANLHELLVTVVRDLSPVATVRNISLQVSDCAFICVSLVERYKVERVIQNLIGNALKFSPPHSQVTVRISQVAEFFRIEVEDRGTGIPQDHLGEIFSPFRQAGRQQKGFGLGLSICKQIIRQHGGDIGVQNNSGSPGCCFWFTLPPASE